MQNIIGRRSGCLKNSPPWIQHGRRPQDCANPETLLKTNMNLPTDFAEEPLKMDVRASSRDVGRNGDGTVLSRLRDDQRFVIVLDAIEHS